MRTGNATNFSQSRSKVETYPHANKYCSILEYNDIINHSFITLLFSLDATMLQKETPPISSIIISAAFALLGAGLLSLLSIPQKLLLNTPILWDWKSFVVPILFGSISGFIIGIGYTSLKRTNQKLMGEKNRYQDLFCNAPISLWEEDFSAGKARVEQLKAEGVTDFEAYFDENPEEVIHLSSLVKVVDVNLASVALHRAPSKEALMSGLAQTFGEDSLIVFKKELLAFISGAQTFSHDSRVYTLDGQAIDINISVNIATNATETWDKFFVSIVDITERTKVENALKNSEDEYRNLIQEAPIGILVTKQAGTIVYANPSMSVMLGYESEQALFGKHTLSIIHPDFHQKAKNRLAKLKKPNTKVPGAEEKFIRKDGSLVDVIVVGQSIIYEGEPAIQGYVYDISDKVSANKALSESEERYRQLVDFSPYGILVYVEGKSVFANQTLANMMGADSVQDILGKSILDYIHPDDQAMVIQRMQNSLLYDTPAPPVEERLIRFDGEILPAEVSSAPIIYQGQKAVMAIAQDIRSRKSLENQLRQAQKMEAVGRLAGGVAHDFNNLLTAISGYTGLIQYQLPKNSKLRQDVDEIQKAVKHASGLTRQLLAFSRQQVLQPIVLDINSTIYETQKLLRRIIGEDIELETILTEDSGHIKADPGQIEQVIINLAVNARDAMPADGKLTIETKAIHLDESYCKQHSEITPGYYIRLAISDNGEGIPTEVLPHIFEPFFTTKEQDKGTGLGLATVHGIVKQSNGHIWVYSEINHGTTFKVYFPLINEDESLLEPPSESIAQTGSEVILLVEDEALVRNLSKKTLKQFGYSVLEAANADEALQILKNYSGTIDLLLTDVIMPGSLNGKELAAVVQKSNPNIAVLFMSGYTDNVVLHHKILEPGLDFIQKPFSPISLSIKIRSILDNR